MKRIVAVVVLVTGLLIVCALAQAISVLPALLNAVTTTATGPVQAVTSPYSQSVNGRTMGCAMTVGSGSGSATIVLEGSFDVVAFANPITVLTLIITDTAPDARKDAGSQMAVYRARVSAISGTGAAVTCVGGA